MSIGNQVVSKLAGSAAIGFYRGRKVLVAGADGFLGSNCVAGLQALGADVSILSRHRDVKRSAGLTVFQADARDVDQVRAALLGQTVVFDFLGGAAAVGSNQDPLASLEGELRSHLTLFTTCAQLEPSPLVLFCSSRLVYGKPQYLPVDERHPLTAQSIYAANKIAAEQYLQALAQSRGLRSCILRLSNPYGPNQPEKNREYGIINRFLRAAAKGEDLFLYGDGGQKRDYIHVADVVTAFLLCAMSNRCEQQVFNLGGKTATSMREVVMLISELAGGVPVRFLPWPENYKAVETGDYFTDLTKISREISLPEQFDLAPGLANVLEAYREEEAGSQTSSARHFVSASFD